MSVLWYELPYGGILTIDLSGSVSSVLKTSMMPLEVVFRQPHFLQRFLSQSYNTLQKITSVSNFTTFSSNYPGWPSVIRNIFRDILRVCWIQLKFCLVDIKTASALTVVNMNSAIGFEGALDCTIHRCTWCSGRHDSHDLIMTLTWKDIWLQRNE